MKNYDEATVLKQLKNKGIKVDISVGGLRTLLVPKDVPNIGIRTWVKLITSATIVHTTGCG